MSLIKSLPPPTPPPPKRLGLIRSLSSSSHSHLPDHHKKIIVQECFQRVSVCRCGEWCGQLCGLLCGTVEFLLFQGQTGPETPEDIDQELRKVNSWGKCAFVGHFQLFFFFFCMWKCVILERGTKKTRMQHIRVVTQELRVTALELEILSRSFVTVWKCEKKRAKYKK